MRLQQRRRQQQWAAECTNIFSVPNSAQNTLRKNNYKVLEIEITDYFKNILENVFGRDSFLRIPIFMP